ncbi:MAG: hypothetical protein GX421_06790 [Caldisericales bacterium]|nr:hypothetical protein [Caldisericales bacterium]
MRKKMLGISVVSVIAIAIGVAIFASISLADTLDLRTVSGHTVWEFRRNGSEIVHYLFENNSHRVLATEFVDDQNGGWMGLTFDIDNFNLQNPNPLNALVHQTESTVLGMSSNYQTDETNVVWDEKHDQQSGDPRFDKIKMYNYNTDTTTTIESYPYPSTVSVHSPWVSGNYVVYVRKPTSTSITSVYLYNISTQTSSRISPQSTAATSPKIKGNYVCWLDYRNEATTGIDIYGYDISTQQEFTVTTASGNQYLFFMNDRYVLFKGAETATDHNNMGVYVFDLQNKTTTTITTSEINEARMSSGSNADNTYVCWDEKVTNNNGTFWAVAYKKVSDNQPTFITDTSTLDYHQVPDMITQSYVGWEKGVCKNAMGVPYLYKMSNQTHTQLDENTCIGSSIIIDNSWIMWTRFRHNEGNNYEEFNICGCALP